LKRGFTAKTLRPQRVAKGIYIEILAKAGVRNKNDADPNPATGKPGDE